MFLTPERSKRYSLMLVSVLEDIGVNKHILQKRRKSWLMTECMFTLKDRIIGVNVSTYIFGSQSEGSTTVELKSDVDILLCSHDNKVIQELTESEAETDLLIIQDENTNSGYCMLQKSGINDQIPTEHCALYKDKVMVKNSYVNVFLLEGQVRDGPAGKLHRPGHPQNDVVYAFPFKTMPIFLKTWLKQQHHKGRLSVEMVKYIESNPCFVVGAGRKGWPLEKLEWRISTSHAERCIMFNLNITQTQCYVMLKLILKTYLKHPHEEGITTFMCKNILLLCIEDTGNQEWCPHNLLPLFRFCLLQLHHCVSEEYCPHYIINENNLMARKFNKNVKQWLLSKIQFLCEETVSVFLDLKIDQVGLRLQKKLNSLYPYQGEILNDACEEIRLELISSLAGTVKLAHEVNTLSQDKIFNKCITTIEGLSHQEQEACCLLTPLFWTSLGSLAAYKNKCDGYIVSHQAVSWLSLGLNSDVASGRLKLASLYYCIGNFDKVETTLRITESMYDLNLVETVCECYDDPRWFSKRKFIEYAESHDEKLVIRHAIAFCVIFFPQEIIPHELQYELFKAVFEDTSYITKEDLWIIRAVVDALPYLYFLQYKTYGFLRRRKDQVQALRKFVKFVSSDNLREFKHSETALNLLGQCMIQEKKYQKALYCFSKSLKLRPTFNAAKFHICILIKKLLFKNS